MNTIGTFDEEFSVIERLANAETDPSQLNMVLRYLELFGRIFSTEPADHLERVRALATTIRGRLGGVQ